MVTKVELKSIIKQMIEEMKVSSIDSPGSSIKGVTDIRETDDELIIGNKRTGVAYRSNEVSLEEIDAEAEGIQLQIYDYASSKHLIDWGSFDRDAILQSNKSVKNFDSHYRTIIEIVLPWMVKVLKRNGESDSDIRAAFNSGITKANTRISKRIQTSKSLSHPNEFEHFKAIYDKTIDIYKPSIYIQDLKTIPPGNIEIIKKENQ